MKSRERFYRIFAIAMGLVLLFSCGPIKRSTPLDESNVTVLISPQFDADRHQKVAVMKFSGDENFDTALNHASDVFSAKLMEMGFTVVERSQMQKVVDELKLTSSGLLSRDEVSRIGRLLNVNMLVMGTTDSFFRATRGCKAASIRFIDTVTGEQLILVSSDSLAYRYNFAAEMADVLNKRLRSERVVSKAK